MVDQNKLCMSKGRELLFKFDFFDANNCFKEMKSSYSLHTCVTYFKLPSNMSAMNMQNKIPVQESLCCGSGSSWIRIFQSLWIRILKGNKHYFKTEPGSWSTFFWPWSVISTGSDPDHLLIRVVGPGTAFFLNADIVSAYFPKVDPDPLFFKGSDLES